MGDSPKPMNFLSPERRRLLALLLNERGLDVSRARRTETIPRRNHSGALPLALNQEGLWFIDRLHSGQANYNIPGAVRLRGRLHLDVLERSLSEIVRRHESLRTTFATTDDGTPIQVIAPPQPLRLPVIELAELPETERQPKALRLATEEAQQPFDLTRGPLFRARWLRLSEGEHVLVLNIHHIVCDGWSMGVFTRELSALYAAFLTGAPSPLPELPIQYADFALWQREWMKGEALAAHLAYWKGQLGDNPPALDLPADRPRPPVQSYRGRHQSLTLSRSLSEALRSLSRRRGVTLFMTLLAGFVTTLYRYTGQEDIVVGSTFANRNRSELEGLIGFFANTLPLRVDLKGNPPFQELLRRVCEVYFGVSAHQELPLAKLVAELRRDRDVSRHPIYQVVFDLLTPDHNPAVYGYGLRSAVMDTLELPGCTVTPLVVEGEESRFDLAVFLWDMPEGISGVFEYSTDLFESATISRMVEQFEMLLHHLVLEPDVRLNALVEPLKAVEAQQRISEEKAYTESVHQKLRQIKRRSRRG